MKSKWRKLCSNRVPLEEEANALQEAIEKEKSMVEYLKLQYEEQKSALEAKQRIASAFSHSTKGITSLQKATKRLLQAIEHLQATFISVLPGQQHEDVASRIPATDQFVVDWQLALDGLSNTSNILEQRLGATTERVHANRMGLLAHDSLRAHATQAVDRMDTIIRELDDSIEDKRFGALHPIKRIPREILQEIFEHAVDEEHTQLMNKLQSDFHPYKDFPSVAFRISATCRHWREIATRTPKLWRHICAPWLDGWYDMVDDYIGQAHFLRTLELAGESGLELFLFGQEVEGWKPILTGECTKQWSRITIIDPQKLPSRLPTTPRLNIYSTSNALEKIQLPRHLVSPLIALSCFRIIPLFPSRATKLTTLDIYLPFLPGPVYNQPSYPDLGELLHSLPSLSRLNLNCDEEYNSSFDEPRAVRVHNTLENLSITSKVLPYIAFELRFISVPSLSVMKILDVHDKFTERDISRLFEAANSIRDTVTDLSISSSKVVSKKQKIATLIRSFSQLKRLELHGFAVTPGLKALLGASKGPSLMQIVVKDYPEGNEKLRGIIDAAGPKASSWTISY